MTGYRLLYSLWQLHILYVTSYNYDIVLSISPTNTLNMSIGKNVVIGLFGCLNVWRCEYLM